ncbi:MAG: RlmE family RNA methyltransferase [Candidatus Bathyarchaeota archaeon]|nr:RlmE family RNA methyltransferase [Candidatus Bathyarchaeota archaeon]MDH5532109.1 RlmE family RNA methyltransferase [Candidatus Bathyarchaeota archaeon]MDH5712802.1 RlmE family RNA methyltransferase [Candidatus Bathyarchaeota archaeon]
MPKAWMRKRKREYYYRKAKEEKFRSRAAYKLLQAVEKRRFIKPGDVVVDLGAAPGGWIQASRKIVGSRGFVLGVDLKSIQPIDQTNVRTLIGDVTDPQTVEQIRELLPRSSDVVISDVSPSISGVWELDHARQIDLAQQSLRIATSVLRPKGNFFVKVFQGDMLNDFVREVKQHFAFVKLIKPKASRARSAELYVLGMNLRRVE